MPNSLDLPQINLQKNKLISETKIVVAMSGGVDSSVVACLLKKLGYQVIGITLQLYDHGEALKKKNACCAGVDIYDAKKVAEKFDFPHYVLNYQNLFQEKVIDDFADSYLRGETPIPCVKCNQNVKFQDLLQVARDLGADYMATGHYVKKIINKNNASELHQAVDPLKDQSYFLFATTKEQLDFLCFPLGDYHKDFTRKLAEEFGIEVANKPDSQDICFVPNGDYASVIKKHRPNAFKQGDIIHIATQKILGKHDGIINFTLGQRRGLGIAYENPLYVIKIDSITNRVFVGEEDFLYQQIFTLRDCNWLIDIDFEKNLPTQEFATYEPKNLNFQAEIRIRSSGSNYPASIEILSPTTAKITMKSLTRAITKGQAGVIYEGTRVLGGGWIDEVIS
ncbi:MAG: tRNA 2-thiouridine(34) synthase MnmA [Alphaproteobacteria bacterium]